MAEVVSQNKLHANGTNSYLMMVSGVRLYQLHVQEINLRTNQEFVKVVNRILDYPQLETIVKHQPVK